MSFRVCFDCGKAWYTRSTTMYARLRDKGVICDHSHYSYKSKNRGKIPDEIEIERVPESERDE